MTAYSKIFGWWTVPALLGLSLVALWSAAGRAQAQTELTLADFSTSGLDAEVLVLLQAPSTITDTVYFSRGSYGDAGTILDGADSSGNIPFLSDPPNPNDPAASEGNLVRIRTVGAGGRLSINDDGDLNLQGYFGTSGAGNDLTIYLQTSDSSASMTVGATLHSSGSGFVNFTIASGSEMANLLSGLSGDDRFIFALARTAPDNYPPYFGATTYSRTVAENSPAQTNVGAPVTANEVDTGDSLTYSIAGDPSFSIVSTSGQIQVAANADLDFESPGSHSVTVTATDASAAIDTVDVLIALSDVNEAPVFPASSTERAVQENAGAGTPVADPVAASDIDAGDSLTYSLSGASEFQIAAQSGLISVAQGAEIDFELADSYSVIVTARDSEGLTATISVTIHVLDLDEFTPIPDVSSAATARYAYIGTLHLLVGSNGSRYGYVANDFGGFTAGRLPGVLFQDGRERVLDELSVDGAGQLKVTYGDLEPGRFKDAVGLQWLRLQVRAADESIIAEGHLWETTACDTRSLCLELGTDLSAHDGLAVGVDFFDAVREVLEAAPGGIENILLLSGATDVTSTGFDLSVGNWIGGAFPAQWFADGREKAVEKLVVHHGSTTRRLELGYGYEEKTGQWHYEPGVYRKYRLTLRDRNGEKLHEWNVQDVLSAMNEDSRRCGDTTAARRLCLAYTDQDLDLTPYHGQVILLQVEDITWLAMLRETPGGPVAGQLSLAVFGAMMFGWRFRRTKSPQREWIILAAGAVSSTLLPIFGYGDVFWAGAIVVIALLAGAGWFFVARSR